MDPESAANIDQHVDRLLRASGAYGRFPTPLEDIVAQQKLSQSLPEDSPLAPGNLQRAPTELRRRLQSLLAKAQAILDRRERVIHVVPSHLEVKKRFGTAHEVVHDLLPHHRDLYYVDGPHQLDPKTDHILEREANYGASSILFQLREFTNRAREFRPGMAVPIDLGELFGASIHAAFRQYIETHLDSVGGLVMARSPFCDEHDTSQYVFLVEQVFASQSFARLFPWLGDSLRTLATQDHPGLASAWDQLSRAGRQLAADEMLIPSHDGTSTRVHIELFTNTYHLFLFMHALRRFDMRNTVRLV